jgi:two-component system response regulator HydG
VRVISATNVPLDRLRSGHLREDFFFRISTVVIELPPLRSRPDDTLVLAQHFANRLSRRYSRQIVLSPEALGLLLKYSFTGNVRELENILEGVVVLSRDDPQTITEGDLKPLLKESAFVPAGGVLDRQPVSMEELESTAIRRALRLCQGNRTKAASLLGISRDTLYRKLRQMENGL